MTGRLVEPGSVPDLGAFLARLVRLDPGALVRLRPVEGRPGHLTVWSRLPFDVLVTRTLAGELDADATVRADELLDSVSRDVLPARHDLQWRGALPTAPASTVEEVPVEAVRQIADAAARTLRDSLGRGVGERRIRDAILDHVAITLRRDPQLPEVSVPTRVVTALARMGFLGTDPVRFATVGPWLSAHATFGSAWYRAAPTLTVNPSRA
ncbi:MAG: hypothetical protein WCA46_10285 [Actinocatenispora sp.]